jgi:hypothetical protein
VDRFTRGLGGLRKQVRHQIFDQASADLTLAKSTSTAGSFTVAGTLWPLLVDSEFVIFNASLTSNADADDEVTVQGMTAVLTLFSDVAGADEIASIALCAGAWATPTFAGEGAGVNVVANGSPLLTVRANLLATGKPVAGSSLVPRSVQLVGFIDATNTDSVNSHVLSLVIAALIEVH